MKAIMKETLKDSVLFCLAMTLGLATAGAQQAAPAPLPAVPAAPSVPTAVGPKIQFQTTVYDFGRVRAGDPVKYTYIFTNTGDADLIITNVQPQCGCTTAGEWTKDVAPGGTGLIPIQFNTAAYSQPVFKQITVTCNDKSQPVIALQLKGVVYKPLDIMPAMAYLNLPPDSTGGSATVTITNNTDEPLALWDPTSNNKSFTAELKTNTPGKSYQMVISAIPPVGAPVMQAQIILKTSWTNQPVLNVPLYANVQPVLSVIPSIISLPPSPLPAAQTSSVTIQNNSTNPLALTDAAVNAAGVEVQIKEMQPGRMFSAIATFPQGFAVPPGQQVELKMKSSNPKYPEVKVPVLQRAQPPGFVKPPPPAPAAVNPRFTPLGPARTSASQPPPLPDVPAVR
jgi:copper(I)-binding protein